MLKSLLATTLLVASVSAAVAAPTPGGPIQPDTSIATVVTPNAIEKNIAGMSLAETRAAIARMDAAARSRTPVSPVYIPAPADPTEQHWFRLSVPLGIGCRDPSFSEHHLTESPEYLQIYLAHLGHKYETQYLSDHGTGVIITDLTTGRIWDYFYGLKTCVAYMRVFQARS